MPIKDIATLLETDANADVVSPYALSFASSFGAHVTGVGVAIDMIVPVPMMGEVPGDVFAAVFEKAREQATDACSRFARDAQLAGLIHETLLVAATPDLAHDDFARLARHFDVTLVQQPNPDTLGDEEMLIEAALFRSGRPVFVVPYTQKAEFKCGNVVVAWDGGVPAARAVADALPILKRAGKVQLVTVSEGKKPDVVDLPGFNITRHLARHGANAELQKLFSAGDVANTLLSHLADVGADLLIMGAYGHSRLREFILGGVTKGILSSMTTPVLMSH